VTSPAVKLATILFADLRGFSQMAASYPAEVVLEALNRCFTRMVEVIVKNGGVIDKFMGDAIMAVFSGEAAAEDARRALACAVDMQIAMDELNRENRRARLAELHMGIGLNSGKVISGRIGSDLYAVNTVIGEEVNLAARIQAFCLRGQILISETTFLLCGSFAETGKAIDLDLKGSNGSVLVHEVLGLPGAGRVVPRQERRRSARVSVRLACTYQVLTSGIVSPHRGEGTVLDLGFHGLRAQLDAEVGLHAEVKLEVDLLPLLDYRARDIYGRIVNAAVEDGQYRVGIEFTSIGSEASRRIQHLVQTLMSRPANWR
jgi:adenylate cyclase